MGLSTHSLIISHSRNSYNSQKVNISTSNFQGEILETHYLNYTNTPTIVIKQHNKFYITIFATHINKFHNNLFLFFWKLPKNKHPKINFQPPYLNKQYQSP